jgi:methyl-accepting chemotaxis protein
MNALGYQKLLGSSRQSSDTPTTEPTEALSEVQALTTTAAAVHARAASSLDCIGNQVEQTNESLGSVLRTAAELRTQFQHVSSTSAKTLSTASEMEELSRSGRDSSEQATRSSLDLQTQMQATVTRIEKLVKNVTAIVRVSETIQGIARQTTLLSFNATIEAARAGTQGKGFAVVAGEVRSLAQHTEAQTKEIRSILDGLAKELTPAHEALQVSRKLVDGTADGVRAVGTSLERIAELAIDTDRSVNAMASVANELSGSVDSISTDLRTAIASSEALATHTRALVEANFCVSSMIEQSFIQFARVDMDTPFHRTLKNARALSLLTRRIFEHAIDARRCSIDDVLSYQYREIKGVEIQNLTRLFDVSCVPLQGFDPPKFATRYDSVVDMELRRAMEQIRQGESILLFAVVSDLNRYLPTHHPEYCQDWTGIPEKDFDDNVAKRFCEDRWLTLDGVRVGLGAASSRVPSRAGREAFIQAGCEMRQKPGGEQQFRITLQSRESGMVVSTVQVPIFVKGHRWGTASCGWKACDRIWDPQTMNSGGTEVASISA